MELGEPENEDGLRQGGQQIGAEPANIIGDFSEHNAAKQSGDHDRAEYPGCALRVYTSVGS